MAAERPVVTIAMTSQRWDEMLGESDLARLREAAEVRLVAFDGASTIEEVPPPDAAQERRLAAEAAGSTALVVSHGAPRVTDQVMATAGALDLVGELEGDRFLGRIDIEAASRRGITVVDTTHGSSAPVAEFALGLAILGLRDAWRYIRRLQAGDHVEPTARTEPDRITNAELAGRTVGVVGFGHIGWRLAELLRPFGCAMLAFDPYAPRELAAVAGVSFASSVDTIFSASDVVVVAAPLTARTAGMITADHLRSMRPGAVFVNVSRGGVVRTDDLVAVAAEDRHVFCLDVLDPEPVPDGHPLRALPNVVLTPHLAGATGQSRRRFFGLMVDELIRHLQGLEPHARITDHVLAGRALTGSGPAPNTDPKGTSP